MKRKLAYNDNEHTNADKRLKISPQDNSLQNCKGLLAVRGLQY